VGGRGVVRPVGGRAWAALRGPSLNGNAPPLMLNDFFALHPALGDLMPLWQAGELGFAHAVATPYRNKRSHFDGQDILEAGTGLDVPEPQGARWLAEPDAAIGAGDRGSDRLCRRPG